MAVKVFRIKKVLLQPNFETRSKLRKTSTKWAIHLKYTQSLIN